MKKHKHVFESDGGECIICRKTMIEIWEEKENKKKKKNMEKKRFTKKQMIEFARGRMMDLLKKPAEKTISGMSEISSYDLTRISKILNEYEN